jgi:glycosyltransferase involved in cell wall biosynthesis
MIPGERVMAQQEKVFSIIVPTYRRPHQLATCLRSLASLDYPRDRFEVLVVDDGGETPTDAVIEAFRAQLDVTLLVHAHAGPAAARNTGAARAKGTFLAFTDDDCAPASSWLQGLADRLLATSDCAVGGRTINALPQNPYSTTSQMIIDFVYSRYNADAEQARFFASNNLALPATLFRASGGFDASLTTSEDRELCDRWLRSGYRMVYAPDAVVHHAHRLTFRSFCRQHFNYGRGACRFYQIRARMRQQPARLEARAFYTGLLQYPFSQARGSRALILATLLVVSQGASAAGLLWEKASQIMRGR